MASSTKNLVNWSAETYQPDANNRPLCLTTQTCLYSCVPSVVGSRYLTLRVTVNIGDPLAIFGGGEHFRTEIVPVGIGADRALQVLAYPVSVVVAYNLVVLVDDENVPLSVHAIAPVVVGEGVVEAARVVSADCVVDEELGVVRRGGFEGNVRLNS